MKMSKKGYLFVLDVVISVGILLLGIAVLFYNFNPVNKTVYYTEQLSEDIVGVMAYTHVDDLCSNPGKIISEGCNCPKYANLTQIACADPRVLNKIDTSLLGMTSELIQTGRVDGSIVKDMIRDIFVKHNVIDEKRFGFAVIYTDPTGTPPVPLELYNTEKYP